MNYRPWSIRVLAFLHFFAPIGNLLMSAWLSQATIPEYLGTFHTFWDTFAFFALLPLAGLAIWLCRWWSLSIFLFAMGWSFWTNYRGFEARPDLFPIWGMGVLYALNLGIVLYFFIPSVRLVYINQRIRWWEAKPRYFIPIKALIKDAKGDKPCMIENVSVRGALVQSGESYTNGDLIPLEFEHAGFKVRAKGEVVRILQGTAVDRLEYGTQFTTLDPESKTAMAKLIRHLEKTGVTRRPDRIRNVTDFVRWFLEVFKTGRGLVPEIPEQFRNQKNKK